MAEKFWIKGKGDSKTMLYLGVNVRRLLKELMEESNAIEGNKDSSTNIDLRTETVMRLLACFNGNEVGVIEGDVVHQDTI